jgi:hypothetical protein
MECEPSWRLIGDVVPSVLISPAKSWLEPPQKMEAVAVKRGVPGTGRGQKGGEKRGRMAAKLQ